MKDKMGTTIKVGHIVLTQSFGMQRAKSLHRVIDITHNTRDYPILVASLKDDLHVFRNPEECIVLLKENNPEHYI